MIRFVKRYGRFYKIKDEVKTEISQEEYEVGKAAITPEITIETPVIAEENFSESFEHENPVTENGQDWKDWSPEEM